MAEQGKNSIQLLSLKRNYLNPALQKIADYVLDNLEKCKVITIKDLATECAVAESTITRFVKEIGFQNFRDFKISIAENLIQTDLTEPVEDNIYDSIQKTDSTNDIIEKVFFRNVQKMQEVKELLSVEEINRSVEAISKAKTLIFSSTGSSAVATDEAIVRFSRAGKRCISWKDSSMQMMVAATTTQNDLMIGVSDSGHTASVINALTLAKNNGTPCLSITSDPESPLAKLSDYKLFTPMRPSISKQQDHWESTISKTSQLLLIDILYVCFAIAQYDETVEGLGKTKKALKPGRI